MYTGSNQSVGSGEEDCAKQIKETLKFFNKEELQKLVDDESRLTELITENPGVQGLEGEKKTIMAYNKSLAEYNLQLRPKLAAQKAGLIQTYARGRDTQNQYDENRTKLDDLSSQLALDTTLALLQTESAKSEEDSEVTAEDFLAGNIDVDSFLSLYTEQRTVAHARKVKVEKLQEIIRTQGSRGGGGPPHQSHHAQPTISSQPSAQPPPSHNRPAYPITNPGYNGSSAYPQNSYGAMPSLNMYK